MDDSQRDSFFLETPAAAGSYNQLNNTFPPLPQRSLNLIQSDSSQHANQNLLPGGLASDTCSDSPLAPLPQKNFDFSQLNANGYSKRSYSFPVNPQPRLFFQEQNATGRTTSQEDYSPTMTSSGCPPHGNNSLAMQRSSERSYTGIYGEEKKANQTIAQPPSTARNAYLSAPRHPPTHHPRSDNPHLGDSAREFKFSKKIYVNGLFPPYCRPASVLIGTRGVNHHRMQSSGCVVQLRGKGCSQPTSPWSEEPMHLFVKYDTAAQLNRFHEILHEIVQSCKNDNASKRPRWQSLIFRPSLPFPSDHGVSNKSPSIVQQVDLLWFLRAFFLKRQPDAVFLDELYQQLASMFGLETLHRQLKVLGLKISEEKLLHFIVSCPHVFHLRRDTTSGPSTTLNASSWSRTQVVFDPKVASLSKEDLLNFHCTARQTGGTLPSPETSGSFNSTLTNRVTTISHDPSILGETNYDKEAQPGILSALQLLIQALHFILSNSTSETYSPELLKEKFIQTFHIPLDVCCFGFATVTELFLAYPSVFCVSGVGSDLLVRSLPNPRFYGIPAYSSSHKIAPKPSEAPVAVDSPPLQTITSSPQHPAYSSPRVPPWQQNATGMFTPSANVHETISEPQKSNHTPRLLGLISRLVEQTAKATKFTGQENE